MAAYMIVEIDVHDPVQYEDYKKMTPGSLLPFQGKFVVRGGPAEALEGSEPKRIVVLEFPTRELAKKWWASPEYAAAKALRQRISTTRMILVDGA